MICAGVAVDRRQATLQSLGYCESSPKHSLNLDRMTMSNSEIAASFDEMADLLSIEGANRFRVQAYRDAAEMILALQESLASMVTAGRDLTELPTIGTHLADKIHEIVETGHLVSLDRLEHTLPPDLALMLDVRGLGPKRVKRLHDEGGIDSIAGLRQAAEQGCIRKLPGFGDATEAAILRELDALDKTRTRWRLADAEPHAESLKAWLMAQEGVDAVEIAGSFRRRKETVGDLDLLLSCATPRARALVRAFTQHDDVKTVLSSGSTRASVIMRYGLQVDLRVVTAASFGAALQYFTGSKSHVVALRSMGKRLGLKINEYGVYRGKRKVAGSTEADVYALFGLPVIAPELREDRGEFDAARQGTLPALITQASLRGDLHSHTSDSDGHADLEIMADAAMRAGLEYLAITDHSQHARIANGLDADRLSRQIDRIDELNSRYTGFTLLKSCEVDILEDGSLDLDDEVLGRLDFRVCAVHDAQRLSSQRQTERLIRAMDNPLCNIIAHPTGRLIGKRAAMPMDIERVIEAAAERRCHLELDSSPSRLDLDDVNCRLAAENGVLIAISSDAHDPQGFDNLRYGVDQARRGWLQNDAVLNTRHLKALLPLLQR